jgi:MFS family permease
MVMRGAPSGSSAWQRTFTALKYRNYRLWFFGQMFSLFGTWMQSTAQGYLVFDLTHSPAYLGYVSFAGGLPTLILTLFGGVVADRVPRRTLMIITQTGQMLLAFALGALTYFRVVQPWHILVLAALLGVTNAFDAPARQSFVLEMVEREDLTNAIALNGTMFNTATAVGPAIGGLTYAWLGPAWCFMVNGISFVAVIIALALMRLRSFTASATHSTALADLKESLRYVAGHPPIRTLIALLAVFTTFGMAFITLMPAWAVTILRGDATTNGLLQSARGLGALVGALGIASLGRFNFKGKVLTAGTLVLPLALLAFSAVRWLPLSIVTLIVAGGSIVMIMNLANALVQTQVADHLRGRVMGLYTLVFFGATTIGGLLIGTVAENVGEPTAVVMCAGVTAAAAIIAWVFFPILRGME